jgi:RHS repeat-associated protein
VTDFRYDAAGSRVKKSGLGGEVITIGGLYERRTVGGTTQHVFYVHGGEGPVAQVVYDEATTAETTAYLHTDALGSMGAVTDAGGTVVQALYFEPFGGRRDQDGNAIAPLVSNVEVGFAGLRHDDELGLLDQRGRVYDPTRRRFLTPDPHVTSPLFGQSFNRYSYVVNDPVNRIDPSGFDDIGWEKYGGGGSTGLLGTGFGFGFGWGGPGSTATLLPGAGSSGRRFPVAGPVIANEGTRAISLPTGPSAPAGKNLGEQLEGWAKSVLGARTVAIGKGIGLGTLGHLKDVFLPSATHYLRAVSGIELADNLIAGAREDGVVGAIARATNPVNPFYGAGIGAADVHMKAAAGDDEGAANSATRLTLGVGTAVLGGLLGAEGPAVAEGPNLGGGRIFSHFTDAIGAKGITGIAAEELAAGQRVLVNELRFGEGANPFQAHAPGDIFVTTLGADAGAFALERIGVFGNRQQFVVQFSEETAFAHGVRVNGANAGSRGIFSIPGGSIFEGTFTLQRLW